MMVKSFQFLYILASALANAQKLPSNIKSFYETVRHNERCNDILKGGFHSIDGDDGSMHFFAKHF